MTNSTSNFESLRNAVIGASRRRSWADAVEEWTLVGLEEDPGGYGICICGQTGLVKLFTIRNVESDIELFPIGSSCINHFGRSDLNQGVSLLGDLAKLRRSMQERQPITMDGAHFSRAMLDYLYEEGVFTADQWNYGEGWNDYEFLTSMFNKQQKDAITPGQQRKIAAIVSRKVRPFVMSGKWAG